MGFRKGLWCTSCDAGYFSSEGIALSVDGGITIELDSVRALTCIGCGSKWLWDNHQPGVHTLVPIASTEAKRLIGEARKRDWDERFQKAGLEDAMKEAARKIEAGDVAGLEGIELK